MPDRDAAGIPDGRKSLERMGWESLPYGCVGLARKSEVDDRKTAWSWLILVPWADADSKPWIDGTKIVDPRRSSESEQRNEVLAHMRATLDKRYGATVAGRAADQFVERFQSDA